METSPKRTNAVQRQTLRNNGDSRVASVTQDGRSLAALCDESTNRGAAKHCAHQHPCGDARYPKCDSRISGHWSWQSDEWFGRISTGCGRV